MASFKKTLSQLYSNNVIPVLRKLPLRSVKGAHISLVAEVQQSRPAGFRVVEVAPQREIIEALPLAAIPQAPKHYAEEYASYTQTPLTVTEIEGGRVASSCCDVLSPDGYVFRDTSVVTRPLELLKNHRTRSEMRPLLPPLQHKKGVYATFVVNVGLINYWHWVMDCVARLWMLEAGGYQDYQLIVPQNLNGYQRQFLDLLGIPESRRAYFGEDYWSVDRLLVPSLAYVHPFAPSEPAIWLREKLLAAAPDPDAGLPRRLYIDRSNTPTRRVLNQDEIKARLGQYGVVAIKSEDYTVAEQIQLFRQAELVICAHGAGLTNSLFMPKGSRVIELHNARRPMPYYWSLANKLGLDYACVTDEGDPRSGIQPERHLYFDPDRIESALQSLNIQSQ